MNDYSDIINNKRKEPNYRHPRMSIYNRSAIFAPFAALTGYSEEINETSRTTSSKIELSEEYKDKINEKLINIGTNQKVSIEYFVKDRKKTGGKYITISGIVKKIDYVKKEIIFEDKTIINIENIININ